MTGTEKPAFMYNNKTFTIMVQKKKSDEQDVLVVRDEKTGEISVVAGLSRDGTRSEERR